MVAGPLHAGVILASARPEARDGVPGYLIAYTDGSTSWAPEALPETWPERVRAEKARLDADIAQLIAFFNTDEYARVGEAETDRLHRQLHAMQQYSAVLGERMAALTRPET